MLSDKVRNRIIILVSAVWAGNVFAGMIPALDYEPKESITGVFMAIVGAAFVAGGKSTEKGKNKETEEG